MQYDYYRFYCPIYRQKCCALTWMLTSITFLTRQIFNSIYIHYTSRAVLVDTIVCEARDASDENEREEDERNVN